jgi:hypothetical protein
MELLSNGLWIGHSCLMDFDGDKWGSFVGFDVN